MKTTNIEFLDLSNTFTKSETNFAFKIQDLPNNLPIISFYNKEEKILSYLRGSTSSSTNQKNNSKSFSEKYPNDPIKLQIDIKTVVNNSLYAFSSNGKEIFYINMMNELIAQSLDQPQEKTKIATFNNPIQIISKVLKIGPLNEGEIFVLDASGIIYGYHEEKPYRYYFKYPNNLYSFSKFNLFSKPLISFDILSNNKEFKIYTLNRNNEISIITQDQNQNIQSQTLEIQFNEDSLITNIQTINIETISSRNPVILTVYNKQSKQKDNYYVYLPKDLLFGNECITHIKIDGLTRFFPDKKNINTSDTESTHFVFTLEDDGTATLFGRKLIYQQFESNNEKLFKPLIRKRKDIIKDINKDSTFEDYKRVIKKNCNIEIDKYFFDIFDDYNRDFLVDYILSDEILSKFRDLIRENIETPYKVISSCFTSNYKHFVKFDFKNFDEAQDLLEQTYQSLNDMNLADETKLADASHIFASYFIAFTMEYFSSLEKEDPDQLIKFYKEMIKIYYEVEANNDLILAFNQLNQSKGSQGILNQDFNLNEEEIEIHSIDSILDKAIDYKKFTIPNILIYKYLSDIQHLGILNNNFPRNLKQIYKNLTTTFIGQLCPQIDSVTPHGNQLPTPKEFYLKSLHEAINCALTHLMTNGYLFIFSKFLNYYDNSSYNQIHIILRAYFLYKYVIDYYSQNTIQESWLPSYYSIGLKEKGIYEFITNFISYEPFISDLFMQFVNSPKKSPTDPEKKDCIPYLQEIFFRNGNDVRFASCLNAFFKEQVQFYLLNGNFENFNGLIQFPDFNESPGIEDFMRQEEMIEFVIDCTFKTNDESLYTYFVTYFTDKTTGLIHVPGYMHQVLHSLIQSNKLELATSQILHLLPTTTFFIDQQNDNSNQEEYKKEEKKIKRDVIQEPETKKVEESNDGVISKAMHFIFGMLKPNHNSSQTENPATHELQKENPDVENINIMQKENIEKEFHWKDLEEKRHILYNLSYSLDLLVHKMIELKQQSKLSFDEIYKRAKEQGLIVPLTRILESGSYESKMIAFTFYQKLDEQSKAAGVLLKLSQYVILDGKRNTTQDKEKQKTIQNNDQQNIIKNKERKQYASAATLLTSIEATSVDPLYLRSLTTETYGNKLLTTSDIMQHNTKLMGSVLTKDRIEEFSDIETYYAMLSKYIEFKTVLPGKLANLPSIDSVRVLLKTLASKNKGRAQEIAGKIIEHLNANGRLVPVWLEEFASPKKKCTFNNDK